MDVGTLEGVITNLGFPIAVCIAAGFFIYKMWIRSQEQNEKREEKYTEMLIKSNVISEQLLATNKELSETNKALVEEFSKNMLDIQGDIKDIKSVVLGDKIK